MAVTPIMVMPIRSAAQHNGSNIADIIALVPGTVLVSQVGTTAVIDPPGTAIGNTTLNQGDWLIYSRGVFQAVYTDAVYKTLYRPLTEADQCLGIGSVSNLALNQQATVTVTLIPGFAEAVGTNYTVTGWAFGGVNVLGNLSVVGTPTPLTNKTVSVTVRNNGIATLGTASVFVQAIRSA